MWNLHMIWAYVDPVTVLPITAIIATVVCTFLLCGKSILRAVVRWARLRRFGGTGLRGAHFARRHRLPGKSEAETASSHRR